MMSVKWISVSTLAVLIGLAYVVLKERSDTDSVQPTLSTEFTESDTDHHQPDPSAESTPKVVSIPAPLKLSKSSALKPKKELKQPTELSTGMPVMSTQPIAGQSSQEIQIAPSVVNKISETTGIPQEDIERAMTQEEQ